MSLERPHYGHPLRKNLRIAALIAAAAAFTAGVIIVSRALCSRGRTSPIVDSALASNLGVTEDINVMSITEVAPGVVDCDVPPGHCLTSQQFMECARRAGVTNMSPPDFCFWHTHINANGDGR